MDIAQIMGQLLFTNQDILVDLMDPIADRSDDKPVEERHDHEGERDAQTYLFFF